MVVHVHVTHVVPVPGYIVYLYVISHSRFGKRLVCTLVPVIVIGVFFSKNIFILLIIAYSYYLLFSFFGYGRYTFSQKTMRRRPGLNFVRNRAFLVSLCHATLSSDCTSVWLFFHLFANLFL